MPQASLCEVAGRGSPAADKLTTPLKPLPPTAGLLARAVARHRRSIRVKSPAVWTRVLVLAVAVNFEPTRFALVPLILARNRPILQLTAYLSGCLGASLGYGLLILFVFHRNPLGTNASGGGKAQTAVGILALLAAIALAVHWKFTRHRIGIGPDAEPGALAEEPGGVKKLASMPLRTLRRGSSPWFAALVGTGVGLPSVDFLAVLVIIATSQTPPLEQALALLAFVAIGSFLLLIPLIGYVLSPRKTLARIDRFAVWAQSRTQIEYAGILALVGIVLIGVGWSHV